ncbi:NADH-dependent flavin oxidoreductase [Brevibacillus dissolubilis]|uniref:NADH-dependent flavin oxidoreductase n=1 Tax=Brevibacillus dissolubilis TaxID=1844116 RepID=UPI0011162954|nr:NADH-dependent flavin oxidoreductase [Brevibacillus dissolubilis]
MNPKYQPLFEPITLRSGIQLDNRLVIAPMTHFLSNPDGSVSDDEIRFLSRRIKGLGLVITACAYVTPEGKAFHGQPAVDRDENIEGLTRLASMIKEQGAKAVLQIHHGGRLSLPALVPNGEIVSASAVEAERAAAFGETGKPRALEDAEVEALVTAFGEATRRAIEAGFDGVEIHGANGYLIHQFFSPHSNRRDDRWGGDLERRMAFPLAVVDAVKKAVADHAKQPFIVGYRFSPEEPETPGITMDDTLVLIDALAGKDLDYLHVSLQEFWSEARRSTDGNRPRIELIQERVGNQVPVIGVGSIHTADEALKAKESGIALVALGRELVIEPDWVEKVREGRESEIETVLKKDAQERLVIPDPLWNAIMNAPGWFPVEA